MSYKIDTEKLSEIQEAFKGFGKGAPVGDAPAEAVFIGEVDDKTLFAHHNIIYFGRVQGLNRFGKDVEYWDGDVHVGLEEDTWFIKLDPEHGQWKKATPAHHDMLDQIVSFFNSEESVLVEEINAD
jgi:hypothetical protein